MSNQNKKFRNFTIENEKTKVTLFGVFNPNFLIEREIKKFQLIALNANDKIEMYKALEIETFKLN